MTVLVLFRERDEGIPNGQSTTLIAMRLTDSFTWPTGVPFGILAASTGLNKKPALDDSVSRAGNDTCHSACHARLASTSTEMMGCSPPCTESGSASRKGFPSTLGLTQELVPISSGRLRPARIGSAFGRAEPL